MLWRKWKVNWNATATNKTAMGRKWCLTKDLEWLKVPLCKKCPYSELFWSVFFTHSDWLRRNTMYHSVVNLNAGKCGKNADQNNSEYGHFLRSVHNKDSKFNFTFLTNNHFSKQDMPSTIREVFLIWWFLNFLKRFSTQGKRTISFILHKKWSFPLKISSVNVINSAVSCGFGHIY